MIMQLVKFQSPLPFEEVERIAVERSEEFHSMPGLVQKYFFKAAQPGLYGGVYIWDSREAMAEYRSSDLAAAIPEIYQVIGTPKVEIFEVAFSLRE
jgi:heme-degrading monooxygenase HmoA